MDAHRARGLAQGHTARDRGGTSFEVSVTNTQDNCFTKPLWMSRFPLPPGLCLGLSLPPPAGPWPSVPPPDCLTHSSFRSQCRHHFLRGMPLTSPGGIGQYSTSPLTTLSHWDCPAIFPRQRCGWGPHQSARHRVPRQRDNTCPKYDFRTAEWKWEGSHHTHIPTRARRDMHTDHRMLSLRQNNSYSKTKI